MLYLYVTIGLLLGVPVVWHFREKSGVGKIGAVALCVMYSVCSVISAMVFAQIEALISKGSGANEGAVSTYGIYFIGSLMMLLLSRLLHWNTAGVLDLYALYAMPSLFMMRLNCLRGGCCGGLPMWDSGYHWPTRESELIFYAVMFLIMWRMLKKGDRSGQLFPLLMTAYGCFRFVNQWFRDTGYPGFHMSHGWSILCALVGFTLLMELRAQAVKKKKTKAQK